MNVKDIKIADVEVIENVRTDIKDKELVSLMESIHQMGLLQAIGVGKTKSGKFVLIYGHRRLTACKKLGWTTIPASIKEEPDTRNLILGNLAENLQREDVTPWELGRRCYQLLKGHDMTPQEIGVSVSVPTSRVMAALSVYKDLPEEYQDKVRFMVRGENRNGDLPASVAKMIVNIGSTNKLNKKDVCSLIEATRHRNMTAADLEVVAVLIKEGETPAKAVKTAATYDCHRIDIMVGKKEMEALCKKYEVSPIVILKMMVYGEIEERIKKPRFSKTT